MAPPDKRMRKTDKESLDYISRLPESVIHHILSFLPFKEIVRSSVVSKTWKRFWSNYPNIDLRLHFTMYDCLCHEFLCIIQRIMDQCLIRKDCIQKLRLIIEFPNMEVLAPILDRWLGAAIERDVSELVIKLHCRKELVDGPKFLYPIPLEVVTGSLKVLEIEGCMFEGCIELPHLWKFTLNYCKFSGENLLNKILCGCPVLEYLDVSICDGVGDLLSVLCKPRLKYFNVIHLKEIARIEVSASSLETFKCSSLYPCAVDLASCTALKHLKLTGAVLSTDCVPIQYLLSKLLNIEELQLDNCRVVDKIEISSSCLKRLVMSDYNTFPGVEIDAPNLLSLDFVPTGACDSRNQFSSWNVPKVEEIHMGFSVKSFRTACRAGLKGFLMKLNTYENLEMLITCEGSQNFIMLDKLHAVSFSSLNKFLKKAMPEGILISSSVVANFVRRILIPKSSTVNLSLVFSSRQSIELMYNKLSNNAKIQFGYSDLRLVSTDEIEHEMDSAWKSFMKSHSTGFQTATIILHGQSLEEALLKMSGLDSGKIGM